MRARRAGLTLSGPGGHPVASAPARRCACAGALMLVSLAMVFAGACGSGPATPEAPIGRPSDPISAATEGPRLVAEIWRLRDRGRRSARVLAAHAERSALSGSATAERWRANGFRLIEVPVESLEELESRLPVRSPTERRVWTGTPAWRPVLTGPELSPGELLELDSGTITLNGGRLRLLGRSWPEVGVLAGEEGRARIGGRTRLEVVPQHAEARPEQSWTRRSLDSDQATPAAEGLIFGRLMASLSGEGERAMLIVSAPPGEDWSELEPGSGADAPAPRRSRHAAPADPEPMGPHRPGEGPGGGEAEAEDEAEADEREGESNVAASAPGTARDGADRRRVEGRAGEGSGAMGPPAPDYPTLGAATLGPWGYPPGPPPTRVVVVLIPEPGSDQRLTPPGAGGGASR